jgi:hypothetical protein
MNGTTRPSHLYSRKKINEKKKSCGLWSETRHEFPKKLKKDEKTDFEPLQKAQISFS